MEFKKCFYKFLALLTAVSVIITALPVSAANTSKEVFTEGVYSYTVQNGEATITDCSDLYAQELIIPGELGGYPVTEIGSAAFYEHMGVKKIVVPESVTVIGSSAFSRCILAEEIILPDTLIKIGFNAFYDTAYYYSNSDQTWENDACYIENYLIKYTGSSEYFEVKEGTTLIADNAFEDATKLKTVILPQSLIHIGEYAFSYCQSLEKIEIPQKVKTIGDMAFEQCVALENVKMIGVAEKIGEEAFNSTAFSNNIENWENDALYLGENLIRVKTDVTEYSVKEGTVTVADGAFISRSCNEKLERVNLPVSVKNIGLGVFVGCNRLSNINIDPNNSHYTSVDGVVFNKEKDEVVVCPRNVTDNYTVPEGVVTIRDRAFENVAFTEITIPASVKIIGDEAFSFSTLERINLSKGLESVGKNAFTCNYYLEEINLPESVTFIGAGAFSNCWFESITLPDNITRLEPSVFLGCTYLTKASLPKNLEAIDEYAFSNCSALSEISIPSGVKKFGENAFYNCSSLTELEFPKSLEEINQQAFSGCSSITAVKLPDGIIFLGESAFENCTSLAQITLPDVNLSIERYAFYNTAFYNDQANWEEGVLYCSNHLIEYKGDLSTYTIKENTLTLADFSFASSGLLTEIIFPESLASIGKFAFEYSGIYELKLPENLISIETNAFQYCFYLISAVIPDSVTKLSTGIFHGCSALETVSLGKGIDAIPDEMFFACESLMNINIPSSAKSIGDYAFAQCYALATLGVPDNIESIGLNAFYACDGLVSVSLGAGVKTVGNNAFWACDGLTHLSLGTSLEKIGDGAFYFCDKLETITFPETLKHIGNNAFEFCTSLGGDIYFPPSVEFIGDLAFHRCEEINSVYISSGLKEIGNAPFRECYRFGDISVSDSNSYFADQDGVLYNKDFTRLVIYPTGKYENYDIPETVTEIGDYAFYTCTSMEEVGIPDSVTHIGDFAFSHCASMTYVELPESVTHLGKGAFEDCGSLQYANLSENITSIGYRAFYNCDMLNEVSFGGSVKEIGNYAFYYCQSLNDFAIPDGVLNIGNYAFSFSGIDSVKIPQSVSYIAEYAFKDCHSLEYIDVDENNAVFASNDGVLYSKDMTRLVQFPGGFEGEFSVPDSVINIGKASFAENDKLTKVVMGNNVKLIEEEAFDDCDVLNTVIVGNGLTKISNYAFRNCNGFNIITIPESTSIDYNAFYNSNGITFYGKENSKAHSFANTKRFSFIPLPEDKGVYTIDGTTYYIENGAIDFSKCGYINYEEQWYSINNGIATECDEPDRTLESIAVTTLPLKTSYVESVEELDVSGGKITLYYDDGTTDEISITDQMVSGFDNSTVGTQALTVSYNGLTAKFNITVTARRLLSVQIYSKPTKLEYLEGKESLDLTGGKLTLVYETGPERVIDMTEDMLTSSFDNSYPGQQMVWLSYENRNVYFYVNVIAKTVEKIEMASLPNKTTYVAGVEELNTSGGIMKVYYNNGTTEELDLFYADSVTGFDNSTPGTITLTVTLGVKTTQFDVTITPRQSELIGVVMKNAPTNSVYAVGEAINTQGGKITLIYSDGTFGEADITSQMLSGVDNETPGTKTVTVSYKGKQTSFDVVYFVPGDLNDDGRVTMQDVTLLSKISAGYRLNVNLSGADVNGDGKINLSDSVTLARYLSGWNVTLSKRAYVQSSSTAQTV